MGRIPSHSRSGRCVNRIFGPYFFGEYIHNYLQQMLQKIFWPKQLRTAAYQNIILDGATPHRSSLIFGKIRRQKHVAIKIYCP